MKDDGSNSTSTFAHNIIEVDNIVSLGLVYSGVRLINQGSHANNIKSNAYAGISDIAKDKPICQYGKLLVETRLDIHTLILSFDDSVPLIRWNKLNKFSFIVQIIILIEIPDNHPLA